MNQHKIKAKLHNNVLTENPDDFIAKVISDKSLDIKDIALSAEQRGGANVSAEAMEHSVNLWFKEMAYQLCDGFSVNTGWFMAAPKIKGVFSSPTESFTIGKHSISFDIKQGQLLRQELENIEIEILGVADSSAAIMQVKDIKTGNINSIITPNHNLFINGNKIKIAGESEHNGVWFINSQTEERIKVDSSDIIGNNPSELLILMPGLPAGTYTLEVITQFSATNGKLVKEPRAAIFGKLLTVG